VLKTNFGSSYNYGLPKVSEHLSSQKMEIVGGTSHLANLKVDILGCKFIVRAIHGVIGLTINILQESF